VRTTSAQATESTDKVMSEDMDSEE
jgi:hypothetical protein